MIRAFFTIDDNDQTGIDWLDRAIILALHLVAEIIKEYTEIKKDRRLAEFDKKVNTDEE